jgi:hypothetical protein
VAGTYEGLKEGVQTTVVISVLGGVATAAATSVCPTTHTCDFVGHASADEVEASLSSGAPVGFRDPDEEGVIYLSFGRGAITFVKLASKDDYDASVNSLYCGMKGWFEENTRLSKTN